MYEVYFKIIEEYEGILSYGSYLFNTLDEALWGLTKLHTVAKKETVRDGEEFYDEGFHPWDGETATYHFSVSPWSNRECIMAVREVAVMDKTFLAEYE